MSELSSSPCSVLLLYAHPYPQRSKVNRRLLDAASAIPGVIIHDLYQEYPDFYIDVAREQQLLRQADLIVFQHPFYWYSAPAILKQWQDYVLLPQFAFGSNENALSDKALLSVISTGHQQQTYNSEGKNRYSMNELLYPFEQMSYHCGMKYLEPFVIYGSNRLSDQIIDNYAQEYADLLQNYCQIGVSHGC